MTLETTTIVIALLKVILRNFEINLLGLDNSRITFNSPLKCNVLVVTHLDASHLLFRDIVALELVLDGTNVSTATCH